MASKILKLFWPSLGLLSSIAIAILMDQHHISIIEATGIDGVDLYILHMIFNVPIPLLLLLIQIFLLVRSFIRILTK